MYLAVAGCSSDPATFLTYTQQKAAAGGKFNVFEDPRPTDALALNYANSVEEIFRARSTGARYTREASDTALAGLSAFAGAAESLSIGASTLSGMGLAGVGILELRKIFDARARSTAYFEAAERIHGAIKDFRAHNLNNVSSSLLSPNGWTLANVVQANIDIVSKILNGHLPSPEVLAQASESMSETGATPQEIGSTPVNNIPAGNLTREVSSLNEAQLAALQKSARAEAPLTSEDYSSRFKVGSVELEARKTTAEWAKAIREVDDSTKISGAQKETIAKNLLLKARALGVDTTGMPLTPTGAAMAYDRLKGKPEKQKELLVDLIAAQGTLPTP